MSWFRIMILDPAMRSTDLAKPISAEAGSGQTTSPQEDGRKVVPRSYVLKPIDGRLLYKRRGKDVRESEEQAIQEADITLQSISLHLSSRLLLWTPCNYAERCLR